MKLRRLLPCLAALALGLAAAGAARADGTDTCIDASMRGQEARDQGKLREAHALFLQCSQKSCPGLLRKECAGWLSDVESRTPTVIVGATDPTGHDVVDVAVTLDGKPFLSRLDGKAMPIDPGSHLFHFERPGSPPVDEKILVRETERSRLLAVRFSPPPPPAPPPPPPPESHAGRIAAVIALGGLTIGGGAAFAALGIGARSDTDALRSTCAPACAASQVDAVRSKEIAADVSLGVGLAAAAGAAALLLTWPSPAGGAARVEIRPAVGGALAAFTARF